MKICLVSFWLLWAGSALAQTSSFTSSDLAAYKTAITIAVSNFDESQGNAYFSEAERNERRGDLNDAVTYFGKAAFEYNSTRNFTRYGQALMRLSNVHFMLANYLEAEQVVLNVALKNYARIGSRVGQMNSYSQLGKICLSANKLTESLWFYTQQGILAQQMGNNTAYLESILGVAYVKIKKGEYVMASRDLNRVEMLARSYNNTEFKGRIQEARAQIARKKV